MRRHSSPLTSSTDGLEWGGVQAGSSMQKPGTSVTPGQYTIAVQPKLAPGSARRMGIAFEADLQKIIFRTFAGEASLRNTALPRHSEPSAGTAGVPIFVSVGTGSTLAHYTFPTLSNQSVCRCNRPANLSLTSASVTHPPLLRSTRVSLVLSRTCCSTCQMVV